MLQQVQYTGTLNMFRELPRLSLFELFTVPVLPYHYKDDIETLEKVQKWATKILPEMKHLLSSDQLNLRACNLTTLQNLHYSDVIAVSRKLEKVNTYITGGLRWHKIKIKMTW